MGRGAGSSRRRWLAPIRARNPDELAFFTGRDQSQALTGWWAQQFGTINYAAHGGFCSVNMAAGGLYTLGGSFWEFGEPDWEHAQYLMLWGVAEDHDSNPIKLGLGKLKARGAKIVAVNPVRTGYGAIADEWIGIRPGTDGLFAFALIHELLRSDRIDLDYLVRYTNAHWLVVRNPGRRRRRPVRARRATASRCAGTATQRAPRADARRDRHRRRRSSAKSRCADGRTRACRCSSCSPSATSIRSTRPTPSRTLRHPRRHHPPHRARTGRSRVRQQARAADRVDRQLHGREHARDGRPPGRDARDARHQRAQQRLPHLPRAAPAAAAARRGRCAGLVPLPAAVPEADSAGEPPRQDAPAPTARSTPRRSASCTAPEDLLVDADGQPRRIDHAYLVGVPARRARHDAHGDPQRVGRRSVPDRHAADVHGEHELELGDEHRARPCTGSPTRTRDGEYRIPRIIYADAYASEMVAYADLVLPDTTYLERFDAISLLDRPISDADGAGDAIRHPVFDPATQPRRRRRATCAASRSVLLDLGARLGLPGMVARRRHAARTATTPTTSSATNARRASACSPAGAARTARAKARARRTRTSCERYIDNGGFWHARDSRVRALLQDGQPRLPASGRSGMGFVASDRADRAAAVFGNAAEVPPRRAGPRRACSRRTQHRERVATYFDPLPIWYEPFEGDADQTRDTYPAERDHPAADVHVPRVGFAERVAAADRRRATACTCIRTPARSTASPTTTGSHVDSHHGTHHACRRSSPATCSPTRCGPGTRSASAGRVEAGARMRPKASKGFLLNHLISDVTPKGDYANADPVTGPGGVVRPARAHRARSRRAGESAPQFAPLPFGEADEQPLRYGAACAIANTRARPRRTTRA